MLGVSALTIFGLLIYSQGGHSGVMKAMMGTDWKSAELLDEMPKEVVDYLDRSANEVQVHARNAKVEVSQNCRFVANLNCYLFMMLQDVSA